MAWSSSLLTLVLLICGGLFVTVESFKITLDERQDMSTGYWLIINCRFYENYADFVNQTDGCIFTQTPLTEADFEGKTGLWTPCSHQDCHFLYYGGGRDLPTPQAVKVVGIASNTATITVEAATSQDQVDYRPIGSVPVSTPPVWNSGDFGADFTDDDVYFRFTLTSNNKSVAVVDTIEIDLGDTVPKPPYFSLDEKADLNPVWSVNCVYADYLDEFWIYGHQCPTIEDTDGSLAPLYGFWTPCGAHCDFILKVGKNRNNPANITFNGRFQTGSKISVSAKSTKFGAKYKYLGSSDLVNALSWNMELDNECSYQVYNFSISGPIGSALVDRVSVDLYEDDPCVHTTNPPATTDSTTSVTNPPPRTTTAAGPKTVIPLATLATFLAALFVLFF